jgi:hypothetical protein
MAAVNIPEWGIGSDNAINVILPNPIADYVNVLFYVIDSGCGKVEAKYSLYEKVGYINDGVSVKNIPHPTTGILVESVEIQIRRDVSATFKTGIKWMQINEEIENPDYAENQEDVISREVFTNYFATK